MEISDWRIKIDLIETQLIQLLNERAEYAIEIGLLKRKKGLVVYDETREVEILKRVAKKSTGPLDDDAIQDVFKSIIQVTRALEDTHHRNA